MILAIFTLALPLYENPDADLRLTYIKKQLVQNGLSHHEVISLFEDNRVRVLPPIKPRGISWEKFIAGLLSKDSIAQGRQFLNTHRATLKEAEKKFGVPQEYIAAIFRIETDFGGNLGNHNVFNVFYTAVVTRNSDKWKGAAENLIALVLYCRSLKLDCLSVNGSYAGAFGIPQFLPASLKYAVDGDGDGVIDLFRNEDAIPSAANFLTKHGWHNNREQALTRYYGSSNGYPRAAMLYAAALKRQKSP